MSDSDDSDSDYNPEEKDIENALQEVAEEDMKSIPKVRQGKIDSLFDDMMNEDATYVKKFSTNNTRIMNTNTVTKKSSNMTSKSEEKAKKKLEMLESIYGRNQAHSIVGNVMSTSVSSGSTSKESTSIKGKRSHANIEMKEAALEAVKKIKRNVKIVEKVKFAGQEISVEKKMLMTSGLSNKSASSDVGGLDRMIEELKGPKTMNTVVKSSSDWDTFKEKQGLHDDLAVASKGLIYCFFMCTVS